MSRLRSLADHDLNEHIVTGVKRLNPGIEFLRVRDVGLEAALDHEVLAHAFRESLCVVSHDVTTMTSAAAATIAAGKQFPGLGIGNRDLDGGHALCPLRREAMIRRSFAVASRRVTCRRCVRRPVPPNR
ncbi:MAG: DUF5615 family PIN-like protein [Planctomycetaceae bacterium]